MKKGVCKMNKAELGYMISLADEKYIDEIFTDRIHSKRKNIFAGMAAAAAVLALICGIGFAVSRTDSSDDLVADTAPDSTLIDIIDEQVDYSLYFRNKLEDLEPSNDFTIEGDGGVYCRFDFDDEYIKNVLPIYTSGFNGGYSQLYFDYKDDVKYIVMRFSKREDKTLALIKSCDIYVGREGSLLSNFKLDTAISQVRSDTEIYGVEYDNKVLGLLFTTGGRDYMIEAKNMSYDDVGAVMDAVLINGISEENFDLSKASELEYYSVSAHISLAEANLIAPFAGCVPQLDSIGDMYFANHVVYSATRDVAHAFIDPNITYNYYDGGERDMSILFYTKGSGIEPYENTVHINNVTPGIFSSFEQVDRITCTIECDGFNVNILGYHCTGDDVLAFRNALADAINNLDGHIKTLAEANDIETFAGFVPQLENVGSLTLKDCYYINYINGKEEIAVWYETPTDDINDVYFMKRPYIQAVFESGGIPSSTLANYITLENITEDIVYDFVDQAGRSGHEGCSMYSITVDCGKLTININADCTPAEMWMYLSEIAKAYDGSEINYSGEHPRENEKVTLEYANESTAFGGFVPQTESIGELFLADVLYNELFTENKLVDSTLHIEYLPGTHYNYQFIIAEYQQSNEAAGIDIVTIEELTEEMAERSAGFATDPEDNFYNFTIMCGEFCINVIAECPEETMREYIRAIKEICPKYTALTLEEAERNELTGGLVPQIDKIGDMTLEDGYCRIEEQPDGVQLLRIKYRNRDSKYQNKDYDYYGKYISLTYAKKTGTITGAVKFDDIEFADSGIDLGDSGVLKYRLTFDCGDFYIGVEALCSETELVEYLTALKALETNTPQ